MCEHCAEELCGLSCTALDALPVAIGHLSEHGVLIYANSAYARLHGHERDDLVGTPVWEHLASSDERAFVSKLFSDLVEQRPEPKPLVLTVRTADDDVVSLVIDWQYETDAAGRLLGFTCVAHDRVREQELRGALQQIGLILIEHGVCSHVLPLEADDRRVPGLSMLSPREREVTEMLAKGYRAPSIARKLHISANTVRNHLKKAYQKLGVHSQEQLLDLVTGREAEAD